MTLPAKGSRRIHVDGRDYRWQHWSGSLVVEPVEQPGSLAHELLETRAGVGPSRVVAMIRHAVGRGWGSPGRARYAVPDASPFDAPAGRDDYLWRKALRRALAWFSTCVGVDVEVGAFWWEGPEGWASADLSAQVRWLGPGPVPEAERWEGLLTISGNAGEMARVDMLAFPFQGGRRLREDEVAYIFEADAQGRFQARGFCGWNGPGEWSQVTGPGILFEEHEVTLEPERAWIEVGAARLELDTATPRVAVHAASSSWRRLVAPTSEPWLGEPFGEAELAEGAIGVRTSNILRSARRSEPLDVALRISGLPHGAGESSLITRVFGLPIDNAAESR